jgi:hypothetical protein
MRMFMADGTTLRPSFIGVNATSGCSGKHCNDALEWSVSSSTVCP